MYHVKSIIFLFALLSSLFFSEFNQLRRTCFLNSQVIVIQLCPTLCDPMDYTVHGILQARILEWVAFPFSRGSSQPRDQTQVSLIVGGFFTNWATKEAQEYWSRQCSPSPEDLPNPRIEPESPALQADSLPTSYQGSPWSNKEKQHFSRVSKFQCIIKPLEVQGFDCSGHIPVGDSEN